MTLILGWNKPDGIYMSVDYRVTNEDTGEVLDHYAIKFLILNYWPNGTGPKALFALPGWPSCGDACRSAVSYGRFCGATEKVGGRPYDAAQRRRGVAGVPRAHQGRCRLARAFIDLDHG